MQEILSKLADTLIANHIRLSVAPDLASTARKRFTVDSQLPRSTVIVVVGAGASFDACGLPLGNTAAALLQAACNVSDESFTAELKRLSIQYRLNVKEFETILLALSRFGEPRLLEQLCTIFQRRLYCAKSYELLAHLLKHRFVDAVINFNFDEILDQAIEDEVGRRNCWMIASDGDLPGSYRDLRSRFWDSYGYPRLPIYIKPHGTASHRTTMKFTREAYFLLSEDVRALIEDCLKKQQHVTLITVGFGMNSVEFSDILTKAKELNRIDFDFIAIDTDKQILDKFPAGRKSQIIPQPAGGVGGVLEELWSQITSKVPDKNLIRGIDRHLMLAVVFGDKPANLMTREAERGDDLLNYLHDRVLVELALVIAKAKGFVTTNQLEDSRVWPYLRQYRAQQGQQKKNLQGFCECLGLGSIGYSRDAMRLGIPKKRGLPDCIVETADWDSVRDELQGKLTRALHPSRQETAWQNAELIKTTLDGMYRGMEVEVYSPRNSRHQIMFNEPRELKSLVDAQVYTGQLLADQWDHLLCVAETGQWLLGHDSLKVNADRKITLIVAFDTYKEELRRRFGEEFLKIRSLPWWLHNQHVTIAVSREGEAVSAVYFERRQRSLSINPIRLFGSLDKADLDALMTGFFAYWVKAARTAAEMVYITTEDVRRARLEVLGSTAEGNERG